jgi:cytochrome c oxidase assembly protein subunit 15
LNQTATGVFRRLSFISLVAVYLLIFVGGLVRSTGSGMGCPDWPKCFGSFIPPTSVNDLPEDYKDYYSAYRDKKNQKFAGFLISIGQEETAQKLLSDPGVRKEADFDPVKTMIEYVNRLIGAVIGLLLTALFVLSFRHPLVHRILTGTAWFLVLVTGWFGSIVVSTNLTPWTVTIHLGLAFLIIGFLSASFSLLTFTSKKYVQIPLLLVLICTILLIAQILMGTTVRSEIDVLANTGIARESWISALSNRFIIHRTFSWVVLTSFGLLSWHLVKRSGAEPSSFGLLAVVLGLISSGAVLSYLGVPWLVQPVHLLLATMAFGFLISLGVSISYSKRY